MGLAVDSYRRRKRGKDSWTPHTTDEQAFLKETFDLLRAAPGAAFNLSVAHRKYGPDRKLPYVVDHLPKLLANESPGTPIIVAADRLHGGPEFAIQRIQTELKPANTEGSPSIDLIHAAVVSEFGGNGDGLFSVGIYVNKPGEHGATGPGWKGNAEDWEFADSTQDTPASDAKLTTLASFLVAEQCNGLPVGGVISQGEWWSPTSGGWQPYRVGYDRFLRHFTHVHVSGFPEWVAGWI